LIRPRRRELPLRKAGALDAKAQPGHISPESSGKDRE
jgi:hypothetical protein